MKALLPDRWLRQIAAQPSRAIRLSRAEGVHVWDEDDNKLLDLTGDDGESLVGYGHPEVVQAVSTVMRTIGGAHASYDLDIRDELLEMLSVVVPEPLSHVALGTSRTEAVEMALAAALAATRRRHVLTVSGASHGSGAGARAVSDIDAIARRRPHLQPLSVSSVAFDDVDALAAALDATTAAALIIEPIQVSAGVRVASDAYMGAASRLCRERGALLIADEHSTALRTGRALASTHAGIVPDVVCLGGGMAGGLPFGAMATTEDIARRLRPGWYESPSAGGAVVCAAALATMRVATETTAWAYARSVGDHMEQRLRSLRLPEVREVRGRGHLMAIELRHRAAKVAAALMERGFIVGAAESSLVLSPPLTLERRHVDAFIDAFAGCVVSMRRERRRPAQDDDGDVSLAGVGNRRSEPLQQIS